MYPQGHNSVPGMLSDEQRAERLQRLAELQARAAHRESESAQEQRVAAACEAVGATDGSAPTEDDEEERFMQEVEGRHETQQEQSPSSPHSSDVFFRLRDGDVEAGVTVATERTTVRRVIGDFELLRLAKMGDKTSFENFAQINALSSRSFTDNQNRNALHYAADSGSEPLLRALIDAQVPFIADDKGLTPLDIAVLDEHDEAVLDLLRAAATARTQSANNGGGATTSQAEVTERTRDELLEKYAPQPPRFVLSKPVTVAPEEARQGRHFWPAALESTTPEATTAPREWRTVCWGAGSDVPGEDAAAALLASESLAAAAVADGHGLESWLVAQDDERQASGAAAVGGSDAVVHHVIYALPATEPALAQRAVVGMLRLCLLPGTLKGGDDATAASTGLCVVKDLVVAPSARGRGVAVAMLQAARQLIVTRGASTVCFRTPQPLPRPPDFTCVVKWYRRALRPMRVFRRGYGQCVFPDFYHYDEVLRADCVLRGALSSRCLAGDSATEVAMQTWDELDLHSDAQCAELCEFLRLSGTTAKSAGLQLTYHPATTVEELLPQARCRDNKSHRVYVRRADEALRDVVVLRLHRPHGTNDEADGAVAQLAYAVFTSVTGSEKVQQVLQLVARRLPHTDVLLAPTHFGLTDSDLVKCNFEELPAAREYVYLLTTPPSTADQPTRRRSPASALATPLFLY